MNNKSNIEKYANDNRSYEKIISDFYWSDKRTEDDIAMLTGAILLNDFESIKKKFNNKYSFSCFLHHVSSLPLSIFRILCCILKQLTKAIR